MNARPIKVLLVDDDEDDYILTREFFSEIKKQRYEIEWASSYDKALEIITSREHDVYLFDYRLGAYSGLELLKETQARGLRVPVILLTGQTEGDVDVELGPFHVRCFHFAVHRRDTRAEWSPYAPNLAPSWWLQQRREVEVKNQQVDD